jgi:hypothetical protein
VCLLRFSAVFLLKAGTCRCQVQTTRVFDLPRPDYKVGYANSTTHHRPCQASQASQQLLQLAPPPS